MKDKLCTCGADQFLKVEASVRRARGRKPMTKDAISEKIRMSYHCGECPDCQSMIKKNVVEGDECPNCGHVFGLPRPDDDPASVPAPKGASELALLRIHQILYLGDDGVYTMHKKWPLNMLNEIATIVSSVIPQPRGSTSSNPGA
jgi:DNA-directed RNA polymerase subunit RPC12/RpoP